MPPRSPKALPLTSEAQTHTSETIELPSGRIHMLRAGSGDSLVILHHSTGNPGWIPFYERLAHSFAVHVPDLPGYGQSAQPDWARDPRDLAIQMSHFLERLGLDEVCLVGLGFGGFVAAELACMNASRLASLVLIGAAGLQPESGEIADQMLAGHEAYFKAGFRDEASYQEHFGDEMAAEFSELWDFSRVMTARVSWKPYMFNRRLPFLLRDVDTPTLLIWGTEDQIVPAICGEQYQRALPNAELELVESAGHLVEYEQPADIASKIAAHARKTLRRTR